MESLTKTESGKLGVGYHIEGAFLVIVAAIFVGLIKMFTAIEKFLSASFEATKFLIGISSALASIFCIVVAFYGMFHWWGIHDLGTITVILSSIAFSIICFDFVGITFPGPLD